MPEPLRSIRVLAVDDDPMVLDYIRVMLQPAPDLELVATAQDGSEAVSAIMAHRPDVVLMDVQMPGVDGITATRRICARPQAPKVVMLTTFDEADWVPRAIDAGAVGYTLKVTAKEDLLNTIRAAHQGYSPMSPESAGHLRLGYLAGGGADRMQARAKVEKLTDREQAIADLISQDLTNEAIGARLHVSASTVKSHISTIQTKLGVQGRAGIARMVGAAK